MKNPLLGALFVLVIGAQITDSIGNVKVVITKQGLDYAAGQAIEITTDNLMNARIEDLRGKSGNIKYQFKNTRITSFTKPSANVIVNSGQGLTASLNGAGVSLEGNWKYRIKFIKDSGSFLASANGVSISVSVSLGRNGNGSPSIASTDCRCAIKDIGVKLRGGASWLYNIFIKFYKGKIRRSLEKLMCKEAQKAINENGAHRLATLNMRTRINDVLSLDYALVSAPIFIDNYVESNHIGMFLNDGVHENAPKMQSVKDRMISVSISEVSFNSGLRVLFKNNKFRHGQDLTHPIIVDLIHKALEEMNITFQGTRLGFFVSASSAPRVSVQQGSISLNTEAVLKVELLNTNGSRSDVFTVNIAIHFQIDSSIRESKVIGRIMKFTPTIVTSSVPSLDGDKMNSIVRKLCNILLSSINEALDEGLPLPTLAGLDFKDTVIHLNERHLVVASNV